MKKERPLLQKIADHKLLPIEFFNKRGFYQGINAVEMHYKDKDGSSARTQYRNYTIHDRPKKNAYTWETSAAKRIVPYAYYELVNLDVIEKLYLGEGATDGVTANYIGLVYAGFHGANNIPEDILSELVIKARVVTILKEADKAGEAFSKAVLKQLKKINFPGSIEIASFKVDAKDLSDLFIKNSGDKENTLAELNELTQTTNLDDVADEPSDELKPIHLGSNFEAVLNKDTMCIESHELKYSRESGELEVVKVRLLANFHAKVLSQKFTDTGTVKRREYNLMFIRKTHKGVEEVPFTATAEEFADPKKLLKVIEMNFGTKAETYHSQAPFAIKAIAAILSNDIETKMYAAGGIQPDGSYVLGNYRITKDDIFCGDRLVDLAGISKAELLNFSQMTKADAISLFKKFINLAFLAYESKPATILCVFPILAAILNICPAFAEEIKMGIEITDEQGSGKTTLHKFKMRFFSFDFSDDDFVRANDTIASIQAIASAYNGASFAINDIKTNSGSNPLVKYAEIIQNSLPT
jgi:hypothetical protein